MTLTQPTTSSQADTERLRALVMDLLRREQRPMHAGEIALRLSTPTHAVVLALQQPHLTRQVRYCAAGWELADTFTPLPSTHDGQQQLAA